MYPNLSLRLDRAAARPIASNRDDLPQVPTTDAAQIVSFRFRYYARTTLVDTIVVEPRWVWVVADFYSEMV